MFAVAILNLVRGERIELSTTGWKPVILPLNEPRIFGIWGEIRTYQLLILSKSSSIEIELFALLL